MLVRIKNKNMKKIRIKNKKLPSILLPFLIGGLLIIFTLEATGTTHVLHKQKIDYGSGVIPSKPNAKTSASTTKNEKNNLPTGTTPAKNSQTSSSTELETPSGTLVSNHTPSLSGKTTPSKIESQCVTSPGALCSLEITKGGVTKILDAQPVGGSKVVYWYWDVNNAGLTAGSWQIKAIATMSDKTLTFTDPTMLEVTE